MKGHFVVFDCSACKKRIFAERSQIGRPGICPLCGAKTVVGPSLPGEKPVSSSSTEKKTDRRRSKRVPVSNAKVGWESKVMAGRPLSADDLAALEDLSETGLGFAVKGEKDRKKLTGFGPPSTIKIGDAISVTLHVPELFRPRTLKAVVKRIVPHTKQKELFRVGAEFLTPSEDARKDLKKLLEKR